MSKKLLCFSIILIISTLFFNISYATDINMDLTNTTVNDIESIENTGTTTTDNTIYSSTPDEGYTEDLETNYIESATTTTTDYDTETELSISNMINIVLIVVGVVLILLGIAIIIKLK